ncbi:ATP-binding cassette domain-containing protein [Microvirga tunisiensis]|uniref:ATP-binding cassette domain-containing protein n=2 Tax=Pannonibacter tanglangensis TaxID=2750084 RepID=A0A7X5J870_9HYPH|nr:MULTISPECIES: ABC transporter ATP-binding protein [unclassified Pannonibacter]NBN63940.1 ATP-binding cassette domain-containing protein [Pannonibacter sp. XCT-34]NBN77577.1 ATP-binding cassette domain-containing protein [Pannonibacter sp. XCT-53]
MTAAPRTDAPALVDVRDLKVDYLTGTGTFTAVRGVSFQIAPGEILGLAGESGCGKSTIAFALMRLHKPPAFISGGSIRFDGRDVLALSPEELRAFRWSEAAMVFQSAMNSLNPVLTVFEQFHDMLKAHGPISKADARARAAEMLAMVGIAADRLDSYPHQLSGGMRQRVVLALGLTLRPRLVIMDEPTTALDVIVQREILQQVVALKEKLGFSVLFITHDLALMAQIADRIAVMLRGEIVEIGETDQMVNAPRHDYTRALWEAMPILSAPAEKGLVHG